MQWRKKSCKIAVCYFLRRYSYLVWSSSYSRSDWVEEYSLCIHIFVSTPDQKCFRFARSSCAWKVSFIRFISRIPTCHYHSPHSQPFLLRCCDFEMDVVHKGALYYLSRRFRRQMDSYFVPLIAHLDEKWMFTLDGSQWCFFSFCGPLQMHCVHILCVYALTLCSLSGYRWFA